VSDELNDDQGLEGTVEEEVDQQVETSAEPEATSGGNPAWGSLKAAVPELTFSQIEPFLKEFDKGATSRIESLNSQYAPWKSLADQGVDPDRAAAAAQLMDQIDNDPQAVYESLGKYIRETGRAPSQEELATQVAEDAENDEESPEDPRLAQLAEGQEQIRQFLQAQEVEKLNQQAEQELDSDIQTFTAAHPELSKEDMGAILKTAAATAVLNAQNGIDKVPTLDEAAQEYFALRTRILSTPRPGAKAPLLAPTSGGIPQAANQKTFGQQTNQETQDLMAALIDGLR
jgi:hypothetical protein